MEENAPLISIIVITYNSGKYVVDTLESAKNQLYQNRELVISDDGSCDDTIALCEAWLSKNREHFVNATLLTVAKNTGIPANCNRGVQAARGEWIKIIAGDDILDERCLSVNIDFLRKTNFPDIIVLSNMVSFKDGSELPKDGKLTVPEKLWLFEEEIDAAIQHQYAIKYYIGNTPTLLIARKIVDAVPFDERFPFTEDRPFAINATGKGYVFRYLDETTVYYRISDNSVFASKSNEVIFNNFYKKRRPFVLEYIYPHLSAVERALADIEFRRMGMIDALGMNKNKLFFKFINSFSLRLNPYYLWVKLRLKKEAQKDFWLKYKRQG